MSEKNVTEFDRRVAKKISDDTGVELRPVDGFWSDTSSNRFTDLVIDQETFCTVMERLSKNKSTFKFDTRDNNILVYVETPHDEFI